MLCNVNILASPVETQRGLDIVRHLTPVASIAPAKKHQHRFSKDWLKERMMLRQVQPFFHILNTATHESGEIIQVEELSLECLAQLRSRHILASGLAINTGYHTIDRHIGAWLLLR